MNLLDTNFEPYLSGCLRTERIDDAVLLHRLTERQVAYFEQANESWGIRSRCSAGIQLKLETNSRTLDLTGRFLPGARVNAGFDVEVDGRAIAAIRIDTGQDTQHVRLIDFATQLTRQITVTLSQAAIPELHAIELEEDAQVSAAPVKQIRYLALGDSITQGMDAQGPASTYSVQLARMLDAELLNHGIGGHIFDLDALDPDLCFQPDIVTVAYGTNDWSRNISRQGIMHTVERYLARLIAGVARRASVYVVTPIWRVIGEETRTGGTLVEFSSAIAEAASGIDGVKVIDGTTLVPHRPDLFVDGTHPNDEGFLHYAINLHRAISDASL